MYINRYNRLCNFGGFAEFIYQEVIMKNLISALTSNIGAKLKTFFVWLYIISSVAAIITGIVGFIWCLTHELVWYGLLFIVGAILAPAILYPSFMSMYGYAIIVHKMEKGVVAGTTTVEDEPVEQIEKPAKKNNKKLIVVLAIIIAVAALICTVVTFSDDISKLFIKKPKIVYGSSQNEIYNTEDGYTNIDISNIHTYVKETKHC
jgi:hypothetical protein